MASSVKTTLPLLILFLSGCGGLEVNPPNHHRRVELRPSRETIVGEVNRFFDKNIAAVRKPEELENINAKYVGRSAAEVYAELEQLRLKFGDGVTLERAPGKVLLTLRFVYPDLKGGRRLVLSYQYFFMIEDLLIGTVGNHESVSEVAVPSNRTES